MELKIDIGDIEGYEWNGTIRELIKEEVVNAVRVEIRKLIKEIVTKRQQKLLGSIEAWLQEEIGNITDTKKLQDALKRLREE